MPAGGAIIAISSHVARGSVGNRAMVFALERLGFTVWAVPTVLLPYHPGHGPVEKVVPDDDSFTHLLEALVQSGHVMDVAGIISGYLASPQQADAVANLVKSVKANRSEALYLCDPVLGDQSGLYVAESIAAAIRDELLPLADVATPNAFECSWLAGRGTDGGIEDLASSGRRLGPPTVLVTSTPSLMRGQIGNLLVESDATWLLEHPALPSTTKGTGDLLAALLLGRRLEGHTWLQAAEAALASTFEIVAGTAKAGADELLLAELQPSIVGPRAPVSSRRISAGAVR
jgi:pyridoxine kinase